MACTNLKITDGGLSGHPGFDWHCSRIGYFYTTYTTLLFRGFKVPHSNTLWGFGNLHFIFWGLAGKPSHFLLHFQVSFTLHLISHLASTLYKYSLECLLLHTFTYFLVHASSCTLTMCFYVHVSICCALAHLMSSFVFLIEFPIFQCIANCILQRLFLVSL